MTKNKVYLDRGKMGGIEYVGFFRETKLLTAVPTEVFRDADKFITKLADETNRVNISFARDNAYRFNVGSWDTKVVVSLYEFGSLIPLGTWDIMEIDPF